MQTAQPGVPPLTFRAATHGALLAGLVALSASCARDEGGGQARDTAAAASTALPADRCPAGSDSTLTLPPGFCATVFATGLGHPRHLVVAPSGVVYVNTWSGRYYSTKPPAGGFVVALRDGDNDGRADSMMRFGATPAAGGSGGTGIGLFDNGLYVEEGKTIVRYALPATGATPDGTPTVVVSDLPVSGDHPMHPFAIDASGALFVNSGSASNACQTRNRVAGAPGAKPCRELETRGGIWKFDARGERQRFSATARFATGIRNAVGIAIGPDGALYSTQHGRDQLYENWKALYTAQQGSELPAEELLRIQSGDDFGWPMCYYDGSQQKLVGAPEYGGDGGASVGDCAAKKGPVAFFPAHWAPDGLVFATGTQFPARYRDGAFIAFHGSWNRAQGDQGGYLVAFQPLANGASAGKYEVFADGFAGGNRSPDGAAHRPTGLATGPDGALYVSDDRGGTIWRVAYHTR